MSEPVVLQVRSSAARRLSTVARDLYAEFGQSKPMGSTGPSTELPHFFLLRSFLGEVDLLTIFNTQRCRYQCAFCALPDKATHDWVCDEDIVRQFAHVLAECRHALSMVERVTLSNEGSVLDEETFGTTALEEICDAVNELRRVRRVELETRLEFVRASRLGALARRMPRVKIGVLTGFETVDERIRDTVLRKQESLTAFVNGLDEVAHAEATLTAYVLFKPDPAMSDEDAFAEGRATIQFLDTEAKERAIPLSVRLNPMYLAAGTRWGRLAAGKAEYSPPRLTDVMRLAELTIRPDLPVYIGLSTEGLADGRGTYLAREDFDRSMIKWVKLFNDRRIAAFPWDTVTSSKA